MTPEPARAGVPPRPAATTRDWWLVAEYCLIVTVATVGSVALAGLVLAFVDSYNATWAVVFGIASGFAAALALGKPGSPVANDDGLELGVGRSGLHTRFAWVPLVLGLMVVLMLAAFWGRGPSQHVLVERDPGSYVNTAVFIANEGGLEFDYAGTPFEDVDSSIEPAVYEPEPDLHQFQFNHLLPALGATAFELGGYRFLFRLPAVLTALGVSALMLLARRVTRNNWLPLLVPLMLGASAPFMYVARDMYSESLTLALVWTAVLTGVRSAPSRSVPAAAVAGWLFGLALATRIDALVYALLIAPVAIVWSLSASGQELRRRVRFNLVALVAAMIPALTGYLDLKYRSVVYASDLSSEYLTLQAGLAAAILGGLLLALAYRWQPIREMVSRSRETLGVGVGVVAFAIFAGLWFLSPILPNNHVNGEIVEGLQLREGVPTDPLPAAGDRAMEWTAWYFGDAFLAIAVIVLCVVAYRIITGRARVTEILVGVIGGGMGALYWWDPSITPDQLWATRRFVPGVYPALAMLVALGLAWMWDLLRGRRQVHRLLLVSALAVLLVGSAATVTWPIRWGRQQFGFANAVESACEQIGDAAVVSGSQVAATSIRAWCGVPTIAMHRPAEETLTSLADQWAEEDRELVFVTTNDTEVGWVRDILGETRLGDAAMADLVPEKAVSRPPLGYERPSFLRFRVTPVEVGRTVPHEAD